MMKKIIGELVGKILAAIGIGAGVIMTVDAVDAYRKTRDIQPVEEDDE